MQMTLVVLGVFSHEDTWLVVEEQDGTFYLPAGRVEEGEDLLSAIARETMEEAGQRVHVEGLIGFDHDHGLLHNHGRLRFVFAGSRGDAAPPKSVADEHTRGARWLRRDQIATLPLRHSEVLKWIDLRASNTPLLPVARYEWLGRR